MKGGGGGLVPDDHDAYEPGLYRVQITDHGIDDSFGEPAIWLEFLPLSRITKFPGDVEGGEPVPRGVRCRQLFGVEGGSLDGVHPDSPEDLLRHLRDVCLDARWHGRPDPSDPHELVGRRLVARCVRRESGGPNAWILVPVRHEYPRPGCSCRTCRDWGKRRRRR
jgi:hypothetical protein